MSKKESLPLEDLLKHPDVQKVTSNINQELVERREYASPICKVFTYPYTALQDNSKFRFIIDNEAKKQLPNIIDNKVQSITGAEAIEESLKERYRKRRNIGVVFSGGPAPGGHYQNDKFIRLITDVMELTLRATVPYLQVLYRKWGLANRAKIYRGKK